MTVVSRRERDRVLQSLHNELGHWGNQAMKKFILDRFW